MNPSEHQAMTLPNVHPMLSTTDNMSNIIPISDIEKGENLKQELANSLKKKEELLNKISLLDIEKYNIYRILNIHGNDLVTNSTKETAPEPKKEKPSKNTHVVPTYKKVLRFISKLDNVEVITSKELKVYYKRAKLKGNPISTVQYLVKKGYLESTDTKGVYKILKK